MVDSELKALAAVAVRVAAGLALVQCAARVRFCEIIPAHAALRRVDVCAMLRDVCQRRGRLSRRRGRSWRRRGRRGRRGRQRHWAVFTVAPTRCPKSVRVAPRSRGYRAGIQGRALRIPAVLVPKGEGARRVLLRRPVGRALRPRSFGQETSRPRHGGHFRCSCLPSRLCAAAASALAGLAQQWQ